MGTSPGPCPSGWVCEADPQQLSDCYHGDTRYQTIFIIISDLFNSSCNFPTSIIFTLFSSICGSYSSAAALPHFYNITAAKSWKWHFYHTLSVWDEREKNKTSSDEADFEICWLKKNFNCAFKILLIFDSWCSSVETLSVGMKISHQFYQGFQD